MSLRKKIFKHIIAFMCFSLLLSAPVSAYHDFTVASVTVFSYKAVVPVGRNAIFFAIARNADGMMVPAYFTWSVTGNVGTIKHNGLFRATTPGTGTVYATTQGVTGEATVTVVSRNGDPVLNSIAIDPTSASILTGETIEFSAFPYDTQNDIMDADISWSVTGGIGFVNQDGLFTATTAGNGTVIASTGGFSASATITVTDPPPVLGSIVISPSSANLLTGGAAQFTATGYDTKGTVMAVPITWSVTGGIGIVSTSGLFTATTAGNGTVVASSDAISASATITVTDPPPVLGSIVISPSSANLLTGGTAQ
ncbi:Ig-like domain-containing protein, partial [bacterium]|nr:Ig-like domain-containing protein [bacterium]